MEDNKKVEYTQLKSELGALIDGSGEDFKQHLLSHDIGYAKSLYMLLESIYLDFTKLKDTYIAKAEEAEKNENIEEANKFDMAMRKVYMELLKIDEKAQIIVNHIMEQSSLK